MRQGKVSKASSPVYGNSIRLGLAIYSLLGIIILAYGVLLLIGRSFVYGALFSAVGLFAFWNVIVSWNNSATNLIERGSVLSVDVHPPRHPFARGYFTIHFLHDGKKRKRLVGLPGIMSGGRQEYTRALAAMQQAGWI